MPTTDLNDRQSTSIDGFDYFVLAGAMVNLLVVCLLVGYWLLAG